MALKMLLVMWPCRTLALSWRRKPPSLEWLRRAQQAEQLNTPLLRDLPVTQGQLAEMWNFIKRKHAQHAGPTV